MGVTSYYSFGGEIIGEETGGTRRDYLTDALGSVTATVTGAGAIENTYRYKPYGEQLAKTGAGSDPRFTWIGTLGYRLSTLKFSDLYVRARHYSCRNGIWNTKDPNGYQDGINRFLYVAANPILYIDPSGLKCANCDLDGVTGCGPDVGSKGNCSFLKDGDLHNKWKQVSDALAKQLVACFGTDASKIAGLLACVSEAESGYCNTCHSGNGGSGMFIIDKTKWKFCTPSSCDNKQICSKDNNSCAIATASNLASALCSSKACKGMPITTCLGKYWGVLPPKNQNEPDMKKCLKRESISYDQLDKIKCPTANKSKCNDCRGFYPR